MVRGDAFHYRVLVQKKPRAYVPPVIRPPVRVTLKPPPLILDPAPQVEVALVELPEAAPTNPAPLPPPAKPAPPRPRPVAQTPKPPPPPPDALPTLPRITQILTAQETRDYNREIDTDLSRSTEVLKTVGEEKPDGGSTGHGGEDSSLPETSSAGARGRSCDRGQLCEACRSPRNRPPRAPALKAAGSEGPAA